VVYLKNKKSTKGRLFDYRRPCDRCSWEGFLRSELRHEEQTGKLVCKYCFDEFSFNDHKARHNLIQRRKIIE